MQPSNPSPVAIENPVDRQRPRPTETAFSAALARSTSTQARNMMLIPEADFARWDQFVRSAEYGTLFHTTWWYCAWGMKPQVYARENAQGEFEIGMILHISRYAGARAVRYPPWTLTNGPVFRAPSAVKRSEQYGQ